MVTNTKKSLKCDNYLIETTFNHKTLNLFTVLNIEISWRALIKSRSIFNAKRARNKVTIWIFWVFNEFNLKWKMEWIFHIEVWSDHFKMRYLLSYCKNLSNWTENNPWYFINWSFFVVNLTKEGPKYGYHPWEPYFPCWSWIIQGIIVVDTILDYIFYVWGLFQIPLC